MSAVDRLDAIEARYFDWKDDTRAGEWVEPLYDEIRDMGEETIETLAKARQIVRSDTPELVAALRAVLGLAEWHETKAEKAHRFPGEGRDAEMAKAAEVHGDAAHRIRNLLEAHLGGAA